DGGMTGGARPAGTDPCACEGRYHPKSSSAIATGTVSKRSSKHASGAIGESRRTGAGARKEGSMVEIRKLITTRETIFSELGTAAPRPIVRAVGMAVIVNPFAGREADARSCQNA